MFYISTRGSTASSWLTKGLNKHKKIICLRSSRSIPPVWPGYTVEFNKNTWVKEISAEKYIESLILFEKATEDEKIFGACHAYHGIEAKKFVEYYKGKFSYLTRNPINMIHSALIYGAYTNIYKNIKGVKNFQVNKKLNNILKNVDLEKIFKKKMHSKKLILKKKKDFLRNKIKNILPKKIIDTLKEKKKEIFLKKKIKTNLKKIRNHETFFAELYINILDSFFFYENELFFNCKKNDGYKMEELVKSKTYLKNFIKEKIDGDLKIDNNFLNEFIQMKRYNVHRSKPINAKQIWDLWPDNMRDIFIKYYKFYRLKDSSLHFGYKMPF